MRPVLGGMVGGLLAAVCACGGAPASAPAQVEAPAPEVAPEVLFAGCEAVEPGPVCRLRADAALRVWVGVHAETPLVATIDGAAVAATWRAAADGLRTEVTAPPGMLTIAASDAGWSWSLRLAPAEPLPAALAEVDAKAQAGALDEAQALLTARLAELTGKARAEGLKLRGDLEFLRGDLPAALRAYEEAFAAAEAAGLLRRASEIALTSTYVCTAVLHDFAGARRWLARHSGLLERLPEARLRHGYYAGLLAERTGDDSGALRHYREYARLARAVGEAHHVAAALSALGVLLARLRDEAGAEAAFAEALALGDRLPAGERALLLFNAAWTALQARARGLPAPDPEPRFAEAARLFGEGPHADRFIAADALLNLAYAAVLRGDAAAAEAAIGRVTATTRRSERWRLYLAGRIDALAGRHAAALRRFTELAARAGEDDDRGLEWSAELGAGEALAASGRDEAALERFRRAAALHRADVGALAIDSGRERFAAERDDGAQRLVALLVRLGRAEEALCAARQARAHAFADLAAATRDPAALVAYREARARIDADFEASWELPRRRGEEARTRLRAERRALDDRLDAALRGGMARGAGPEGQGVEDMSSGCSGLRAPAEGELLLVYYPLALGYVGFAAGGGGVVAAALSAELPGTPEARADALLGPFAAAIERAGRISVAASGALGAEAFHALPWRGAPLIAARPVAYTLDLPRAPGPGRALARAVQLVPPSNLARAGEEADAVAELLRARGVALTRLRGDEPALTAALADVDLLHFVGHARGDGWGGALDLGGARGLSAGDLLVGPAPRLAVLSGCETGLLDPRAHAGGMSLAHALLLAGADAVIAADARVADDLAAALIPATVAAIAGGEDPAAALRGAQERLRGARADWSRFRVFVP